MKINAILTGICADLNGSRYYNVQGLSTVGGLKEEIQKKIPELNRYSFNIAVNGILADDSLKLAEEDKIIIFCPFAGG